MSISAEDKDKVKNLITFGKKQGYLSHDDILDVFPEVEDNLQLLEYIVSSLQDSDIEIIEPTDAPLYEYAKNGASKMTFEEKIKILKHSSTYYHLQRRQRISRFMASKFSSTFLSLKLIWSAVGKEYSWSLLPWKRWNESQGKALRWGEAAILHGQTRCNQISQPPFVYKEFQSHSHVHKRRTRRYQWSSINFRDVSSSPEFLVSNKSVDEDSSFKSEETINRKEKLGCCTLRFLQNDK